MGYLLFYSLKWIFVSYSTRQKFHY